MVHVCPTATVPDKNNLRNTREVLGGKEAVTRGIEKFPRGLFRGDGVDCHVFTLAQKCKKPREPLIESWSF